MDPVAFTSVAPWETPMEAYASKEVAEQKNSLLRAKGQDLATPKPTIITTSRTPKERYASL